MFRRSLPSDLIRGWLLCREMRLARSGKRAARRRSAGQRFLRHRGGDETFALRFLAGELARAAHRFTLLPRQSFRWLLVKSSAFHLPEDALALHLLFEDS